MSYDPDVTLSQLRVISSDPIHRPARDALANAAVNARELWPDPDDRVQAGRAIAAAVASFSSIPQDNGQRVMLNLIGLFGLALVDDAHEQVSA